jgi:hypothetical protein
MEPEGSLLHLQVPATCLYAEPAQSNPYPTPYFLKIILNIILLSRPGSPQWSFSLSFPHQNPLHASPFLIRATCPAHLISILSPAQCWVRSTDHEALHYEVFSSRLLSCPSEAQIFSSTPYSQTPSLRSSLNVSDKVSHPYRTTGKIMVLYILIFKL